MKTDLANKKFQYRSIKDINAMFKQRDPKFNADIKSFIDTQQVKYKMIARVYKGKFLVGYKIAEILNGRAGQNRLVTKQELWRLSKEGRIANIKAGGTEDNATITGINNFRIKDLPIIKL